MDDVIEVPELLGDIVAFAKIGKKEHLKKLQQGILRFRDLSFYANKENKFKGWHDSREQIRGVFQADKAKLKIKMGDEERILDSSTGLINQLYFGYAKTNDRIFCLHSLADGIWPHNDIPEYDEKSLQSHFKIPSHFKEKFEGDHVWIILGPKEFLRRLKKAVEEIPNMPHGVQCSPVHYVDFKTVHGSIPSKDFGLVKDIKFSEEKEYRLIAHSSQALPDPFELPVGDLSDISLILSIDEFNKMERVKFVEYEEEYSSQNARVENLT